MIRAEQLTTSTSTAESRSQVPDPTHVQSASVDPRIDPRIDHVVIARDETRQPQPYRFLPLPSALPLPLPSPALPRFRTVLKHHRRPRTLAFDLSPSPLPAARPSSPPSRLLESTLRAIANPPIGSRIHPPTPERACSIRYPSTSLPSPSLASHRHLTLRAILSASATAPSRRDA